jgi:hypothetical protein
MKIVSFILFGIAMESSALWSQPAPRPTIPKTWDEAALADWATPIAGLNARPTHISAKDYYSLAVENVRTYPVYFPGNEPPGYWEMLQHAGPMPLIEPDKLKSEADWIEAGRRVFEEADHIHLRTFDPKLVATVRSRESLEQIGVRPTPDGALYGMRWVPTKQGLALSIGNCSLCHIMYLSDGTRVPGAPVYASVSRARRNAFPNRLVSDIQLEHGLVAGEPPFHMGQEPIGMSAYRAHGVPWIKEDINERLKVITSRTDFNDLLNAGTRSGAVLRWNGSLYYPAKIPDLIGVKDRKYIDHTATHLHRGVGDLMRYAALVSYAETADFGPYHMLAPDTKRVQARLPDEALYALALYIYSLQPPRNPNLFDEKAQEGQKIFTREGCPMCHTPPLYTSNKLTLAQGFTPPKEKSALLDVLAISVGTDPGLSLMTRKGTGYYKVPSLKGIWYRGHYLHDGSAASLEEMFDPDRLKVTHVPGGWLPPGSTTRAIKGHEFGLNLKVDERDQLIAFLRTL